MFSSSSSPEGVSDGKSFELRMEGHHLHSAFLSHHRGIGPPVVPQKLFANWEMDRAHPSAVQRVFTLSVSRLALFPCPSQMRSLVITAKLEGYKRSLRSNEIVLGDMSAIDLPLDISFTVQYPHFLKHKSNLMQIHVQRKRKYKNRPIPGGFKSVAYGSIDLTAMLQSGGQAAKSEMTLYTLPSGKGQGKEQVPVTSIGRIVMQSCATLPLEADGETGAGAGTSGKKDKVVELSDDSEISEEDDSDLPNDGLHRGSRQGAPGSERLRDSQRRRKRAQHKKNMKQRLVNLLKKFRVPDEGGNEATVSSTGREPTAKELQALFDELDELSDSGNEGVAADEISIVSNPRPGLRPYFSSREQLPLPAIEDERASESEGDGEDVEWSSETEAAMAALQVPQHGGAVPPHNTPRAAGLEHAPSDHASAPNAQQASWQSGGAAVASGASPWKGERGGESSVMTHSITAGSIAVMREKDKVARNASLSDQLYAILSTSGGGDVGASAVAGGLSGAAAGGAAAANGHNAASASAAGGGAAGGGANECIWLCQFADDSMLDSLAAAHAAAAAAAAVGPARPPPLHLIATATARDVRAAIQQIVAKIQLFCNSNSVAPPLTWIGVMGADRLVSQVLRAYVDVLQHKSSSSWLQYIRFLLVVPPTSHVGRLVAAHDSALEALSRDIWERWAELTPAQHAAAAEKLCAWPSGGRASSAPCVNLLIGEALVQLNTKDAKELAADGNDRLFVPFLSEVRLCGEEEGSAFSPAGVGGSSHHPSSSASASPRGPPTSSAAQSADPPMPAYHPEDAARFQYHQGQSSPPASPHTKGSSSSSSSSDRGEVQVEYWLSSGPRDDASTVGGGGGGAGGTVLAAQLMPGQLPATPGSKKEKENVKESMKSHFKTLMISRPSNAPLLKLQFIKEKKKDKMFQKLGMKNKSKNDIEASPSVIANVSRLLCSAQGKHSLTVLVDGCAYGDVRFFSTSSQWQTHVKYFPVGLMTHHLT